MDDVEHTWCASSSPAHQSGSVEGSGGGEVGQANSSVTDNGGGVCGGAANKMMALRVQMLDDSITLFQVQVRKLSGWP